MKNFLWIGVLLISGVSCNAFAAPVLFNVSIDTSSRLDPQHTLIFQNLLVGDLGLDTIITVSNFSGASIVAPIVLDGPGLINAPSGATGALGEGEMLVFDGESANTGGPVFQEVILGNVLTFDMRFDGNFIGAPSDGPGRSFLGLIINDRKGNVVLAGQGGAFNVGLELDTRGVVEPVIVAGVTTVTQLEAPLATVPTPNVIALVLIGLFGMKLYLPKRKKLVPIAA